MEDRVGKMDTIDVAEGALEVMGPAADGLEQVLDMEVGVGRRGFDRDMDMASGCFTIDR